MRTALWACFVLAFVAASAAQQVQRVRCGSSTGDFVIEVHPDWSPNGAARFLDLVSSGFFTDSPLFRVVPGFIAQFGVGSTPESSSHWLHHRGPIPDDPNIGIPVRRGTMALAAGDAENSRIMSMWVSFTDNDSLGKREREIPFAQVAEGMENIDRWYSGYGDVADFGGNAPNLQRIMDEGNTFLKAEYPDLSYISSCQVEPLPEEDIPAEEAIERKSPTPSQLVRCGSSTGDVVIEVKPDWAPNGASRFIEMVQSGFFTDSPLFRVVPDFMVQFGISSSAEVNSAWENRRIPDDPNIGIPVKRGTLAFAGNGEHSRNTEMWIAFQDNDRLGHQPWDTPFARVIEGMENVDGWYSGYGDAQEFGGNAPDKYRMYTEGSAYVRAEYPELSFLSSCHLVTPPAAEEPQAQHPREGSQAASREAPAEEAHHPQEPITEQQISQVAQEEPQAGEATGQAPARVPVEEVHAEQPVRPDSEPDHGEVPSELVRCGSSTGDVVVEVRPDWAPNGAARFIELVQSGFFTDSALFRVVPDFMVQFGIGAIPEVSAAWKDHTIADDPNIGIPVKRGTLAFGGNGEHSRSTEMWIAYQDNDHLGHRPWETPFAQVIEGMENVDRWFSGYGDVADFGGNAPDQRRMYEEGNVFLRAEYPQLSYLTGCKVESLREHDEISQGPPSGMPREQSMKATGGDFNTRGQEDEIVERLRRMESEIKKDLGGASLLHGAKDESHESLVTGVIATVVLVIVLLMLSSFGGKSKLD